LCLSWASLAPKRSWAMPSRSSSHLRCSACGTCSLASTSTYSSMSSCGWDIGHRWTFCSSRAFSCSLAKVRTFCLYSSSFRSQGKTHLTSEKRNCSS
ncbi:unnamed protein product, partial [Ixodes pacificus]